MQRLPSWQATQLIWACIRASIAVHRCELLLCRDVRTSQGTFVARRDDKQGVLAWVEDKIASLTGIPVAAWRGAQPDAIVLARLRMSGSKNSELFSLAS